MKNKLNLTEGKIASTLTRLALPIMGTSFINMAYNLTDIMWLGRLSTEAVAAAGTAGFFLWLGAAIYMMPQVGIGVSVSQSLGREDDDVAQSYISNGFQLNIFLAIIYSIFLYLFRYQIIGFFNLGDPEVISMAIDYLSIISIGIIFHFINPMFAIALNSSGNSMTPFRINAIGLVTNIILDPLLIFGIGPFPALGVKGAAIATILAQIVVTIIFITLGKYNQMVYSDINIFKKPNVEYIKRIIKLGFPPSMQMALHAIISMIITRLVAAFGPIPVAVQNIGSQIESLSWMTSEGFSTAISAFVGHNFGAKKIERIKEGYLKGMQILGSIGLLASILLIFAAKPIFTIFTPNDPVAIKEGIIYLRILGLSQFFVALEIGTAGAFNGLGKTIEPTLVTTSLNILRIPLAIFLSGYTALALSGIWWSISFTSILKGIILVTWFTYILRNKLKD